MQVGQEISLSPSFNSFSDSKIAAIAARVVDKLDSDEFHDDFRFERLRNPVDQGEPGRISNNHSPELDADDDDDFDFSFVTRDSEPSSQIPADEIFENGKIRPVNPVTDRNLLLNLKFQSKNAKENGDRSSNSDRPRVRHPLSSLFIEETETETAVMTISSSSFSSETDETGREAAAKGWWKKSASAADSSKRWKLKSILQRSNSFGSKDCSVFLSRTKKERDEKKAKQTALDGGAVKLVPPLVFNRDGGEKLRSYLPYRLDLVGFFGNVNGPKKT